MDVRVLVTGCAGFIGSHIADEMAEMGCEVFGIDNLSTGKKKNINKRVIFNKIDLCDTKQIRSYVNRIQPHIVFHVAALARIQPSIKAPIMWAKNNEMATLNLLEACRNAGSVKRFIYSSSSSVYGDNPTPFKEWYEPSPKNPYAVSKLAGEKWCQLYSELYKLDTVVLRYFNVYGPRQVLEGDNATIIGIFTNLKKQNKFFTIYGDGKQRRDFTHVFDVVRANVFAMVNTGFGIYNIGTGKNYSVLEVAEMIDPDKSGYVHAAGKLGETRNTKASIKKAKREWGWEPLISLKEGLNEEEGN
jgi:UDP-glucose 4-epimerase